jgi:hypothetical protein
VAIIDDAKKPLFDIRNSPEFITNYFRNHRWVYFVMFCSCKRYFH